MVEPLIVGLAAGHVVVAHAVVVGGVAGDGDRARGGDNKGGVGIIARAAARVVDEDITRLDVVGRPSEVAAGTGPAESGNEAVTEVLGADLLPAAGVASAGCSAREVGVVTGNKALGNEVGAIATVTTVAAGLTAPVAVRGAGSVSATLVVGRVPPLPGIVDCSVSVVREGGREECSEDADRLQHFFLSLTELC